MSFFVKANQNESLIFQTFGVPLSISRRWSVIPFPCCQSTRRFNVGQYKMKFDSNEIMTRDQKTICLTISLKFYIDTSSKSNIMKAFKDFCEIEESKSNDHSIGANKATEFNKKDVFDIKDHVKDIVFNIVSEKVSTMNLTEIIQYHWLFMDCIFTKVKYILLQNCVILEELYLEEIREFTSIPQTVEYEEESIYETAMEVTLQSDVNTTGVGDKVVYNNDIRSSLTVSDNTMDRYESKSINDKRIKEKSNDVCKIDQLCCSKKSPFLNQFVNNQDTSSLIANIERELLLNNDFRESDVEVFKKYEDSKEDNNLNEMSLDDEINLTLKPLLGLQY